MYASHLCIARLCIYVHYICLYTQVNIQKVVTKIKEKNNLFFCTQFYVLFYLPVSLKL